MAETSKNVRQRHMQANYINVGASSESYVLMGLGFTDLNESPAAQTSSKRYVNDKANTKRITGYDWTAPFTTDQIRSDEAVDFICKIGELQKVGADTETDYVIVDLDKKGKTENVSMRENSTLLLKVASFENNDGEMSATGNLLQIGDLVEGTFDTSSKSFTEGLAGMNGE